MKKMLSILKDKERQRELDKAKKKLKQMERKENTASKPSAADLLNKENRKPRYACALFPEKPSDDFMEIFSEQLSFFL